MTNIFEYMAKERKGEKKKKILKIIFLGQLFEGSVDYRNQIYCNNAHLELVQILAAKPAVL